MSFHALEEVVLSNQATAGAGKLLAFPPDREQIFLGLPPDLAKLAKKGRVDMVTLSGDSLSGIGLLDGDRVLCKTAVSKRDIGANSICIVHVRSTNETLAKRVIHKDGMIILRSFNPDIPDQEFNPEDIEVQGVVLHLLLSPDNYGRFRRLPETKPISQVERKVRVAKAMQGFKKKEEEEFEF